jgi:PPOX class probable F420-dependent enzyme
VKALDDVAALGMASQGLAVVSVVRANGTVHSSVVNAGVMVHPASGESVVAFVTYGPVKLRNLRRRSGLSVTFRDGWRWATVEGLAQLVGPDDPTEHIDAERLRLLLREVFTAAGGSHDDWEAYDRAMAAERRTAVLVTPTRVYGV